MKGKKSRKLVEKGSDQEYAEVIEIITYQRVRSYCYDGTERVCVLRGTPFKKNWIGIGDLILVALREQNDDKADIIHKYRPDEVEKMRKLGMIPSREEVEIRKKDSRK